MPVLKLCTGWPFYLISVEYVLFKVGTKGATAVARWPGGGNQTLVFCAVAETEVLKETEAVPWSDRGEQEEHTGLSVVPPLGPVTRLDGAHRMTLALVQT